jgi:hypothetical protein
MNSSCEKCDLSFEQEPGYYYGAMYVSYALGVALFVTIWTSCNLWLPWLNAWGQIGLVVFFTIALSPYLFALSKIIWANMFIKYDKNAKTRK